MAEDPKYLIPFYDNKLGKAFGDGEKYGSVTCVDFPVTVHRRGQCRISYVYLIYIWII